MKAILILLFITLSPKVNSEIQSIDSLLYKSLIQFRQRDFLKSIELADKAYLKSQGFYTNGLIYSSLYKARSYYELGFYNEALKHVIIAEKYSSNDATHKVEIKKIKGQIFGSLNLNQLSKQEFNHLIDLSQDLNESEKKLCLLWSHEQLMFIYEKEQHLDSMFYHLDQQFLLTKKIDKARFHFNTYLHAANYYRRINQLVESANYLEKAHQILQQDPTLSLYPYYLSQYQYSYSKRDYKSCERNLLLALENIKNIGFEDREIEIYSYLKDLYFNHLNNKELAFHYLSKYQEKSKLKQNQTFDDNTLNYLLNNKKSTFTTNYNFLIIILISIGIILITLCYVLYKKYKHRFALEAYQKDEKDHSIQSTDQKFRHLIDLVKQNNPEFLILFKELYPDFVRTIKRINPTIKSTEMSFLAMCYLNLSTKDIAEYTYVTVRAVQIRKNRIRKKYQIPSNKDFNSSIRELKS